METIFSGKIPCRQGTIGPTVLLLCKTNFRGISSRAFWWEHVSFCATTWLHPIAQGCEATLGIGKPYTNPEWVESGGGRNPIRVGIFSPVDTQGSSFLATLGSQIRPLRGSSSVRFLHFARFVVSMVKNPGAIPRHLEGPALSGPLLSTDDTEVVPPADQEFRLRRRTMTVVRLKARSAQVAGSGTANCTCRSVPVTFHPLTPKVLLST